jgi:secreted PhoX family phosphatase
MSLKRRNFLKFLAGGTGAVALGSLPACETLRHQSTPKPTPQTASQPVLPFSPINGPMPLTYRGLSSQEQIQAYQTYAAIDDVVLPDGFTYQTIAAWGDPVGNSRFGYNNDYLSFVETDANAGYLTVNFEYISAKAWMEAYPQVIGKSLPFAPVIAALKGKPIDAYALPDNNPLKAQIRQICQESLIDQGLGTIALQRGTDGKWTRKPSAADRRVTGLSGLTDDRYLKATGPAVAVFRKTKAEGYLDQLGDRIIGTFANCAGGTTPWGTVLSAEENFQDSVPELVYRDGTSLNPSYSPFNIDAQDISGQGNVFGLAGNKYGWIVEIDPANPNDYGTKHTGLGRYRHEAIGIRVEAGKPLAFYSGCDRRSGHVYKFVSSKPVVNPQDKANSQLLAEGILYAAKFNPDGTGQWLPLIPSASVDPDSPSQVFSNTILLPADPRQGYLKAKQDAEVAAFKQKFKTLGDIYTGTAAEKQGAIAIDAHYAANAIGATCTARPEDTEIAPDGSLYITFTSGSPDKESGPDQRIFKSPTGDRAYEFGWVMHLIEENNDPAALKFRWQMAATGGEPSAGGGGFANPDNLLIDPKGNLWMVTDMSTTKHNAEVKSRSDKAGKALDPSQLTGLFGNNSMWYMPTSGDNAGTAYLFALGPMECEMTGPYFSRDRTTLFLAVQHPGEANGTCKERATEAREFVMKTTDGQEFKQTRKVPIGSNWPTGELNAPPKPAVVAIYRHDIGAIV